MPRTFKEICAVCLKKRSVVRTRRVVVERVTPDDLVNRFCSKLGLTRQVRREVAELTVKNAETTVLGCSSGDLLDLGQISERNQRGVSEVTIRYAVKLLCNRK